MSKERYEVSLRILSECRKIPTKKTLNTNTFQVVNKDLQACIQEPDKHLPRWCLPAQS